MSPLVLFLLHPAVAAPDSVSDAQRTLDRCETTGCDRRDGADAAAVVALHTWQSEGIADPTLIETVRVLDSERLAALPSALSDVRGEAFAWTRRVGGRPPEVLDGVVAVRVDPDGQHEPGPLESRVMNRPLPTSPISPDAAGWDTLEAARAEAAREQLQSAVRLYRALLADPEVSRPLADLAAMEVGRLHLEVGWEEHAVAYYAQVQDAPYRSLADVEQGIAFMRLGQREEARRLLKPHRKSDPLVADLLASLAER